MNILNIYKMHYADMFNENCDYSLIRINKNYLVGHDKEGNVALVIRSEEESRDYIGQKTKELCFECNLVITYEEDKIAREEKCHVIKCKSQNSKERRLFLELCDALFINRMTKIDYIVETFDLLRKLFVPAKHLSNSEAQGLYAELYTIYHFKNVFNFSKSWQNKDKMKFDFSISDLVKLEIKSTRKSERVHRFRHDQLATNVAEIYVLSYKFQEDNNGLSLCELLKRTIPILQDYPQKQARLISILYDENNNDILNNTRFLETYTIENMLFLDAKKIPKFKETSPANITNAEYDSNCEGIDGIGKWEMIERFKLSISEQVD